MTVREMILRGRIIQREQWNGNPSFLAEYGQQCLMVQHHLIESPVKLINGQSVYRDLSPPQSDYDHAEWSRSTEITSMPRPMPPFPFVWLEALTKSGKVGTLILRGQKLDSPKSSDLRLHRFLAEQPLMAGEVEWNVVLYSFVDVEGSVMLFSRHIYCLDKDYAVTRVATHSLIGATGKAQTQHQIELHSQQAFVLTIAAMARINCHNVTLEARSDGRKLQQKKLKNPPVVWHDIKVGTVPRMAPGKRLVENAGDHTDLRSHWVRGHFADYTKGRGLFGNPKLRTVFWIPEFTKGAKEVGEVVGSYIVE